MWLLFDRVLELMLMDRTARLKSTYASSLFTQSEWLKLRLRR